jgi:hypothetical protein
MLACRAAYWFCLFFAMEASTLLVYHVPLATFIFLIASPGGPRLPCCFLTAVSFSRVAERSDFGVVLSLESSLAPSCTAPGSVETQRCWVVGKGRLQLTKCCHRAIDGEKRFEARHVSRECGGFIEGLGRQQSSQSRAVMAAGCFSGCANMKLRHEFDHMPSR